MLLLSCVKKRHVTQTNKNAPIQAWTTTERLLSQHRDSWSTNKNKRPIFNSPIHCFLDNVKKAGLKSSGSKDREEEERKLWNLQVFSLSFADSTLKQSRRSIDSVAAPALDCGFISALTVSPFSTMKKTPEQDKLILFMGSFAHLTTLHAGPCYVDFPPQQALAGRRAGIGRR